MDTNTKLNTLNENFDLKKFMANLRSGNLVKLIESSQLQFEEKCSYLTQKLHKSEEEMRRKVLILQQNAHLIENFQKQLQELSDQYNELLNQHQETKQQNESLHAQLQCSEDKFAHLDILYDQQVTDLTERNNYMMERSNELEQQLATLEYNQEQNMDQFDKSQRDFNEMQTRAEQRNIDLLNELNSLHLEKKKEVEGLKTEISQLKDVLNQKTIDYEERIQDLESRLLTAADGKKEVYELENQIAKLNHERKADQKAFENEKARAATVTDELKNTIEDLKLKLFTKEKEVEEVYVKFKQITRVGSTAPPTAPASLQTGSFLNNRKHASPSDSKLFGESTDSDASSVSFYKSKFRRISTDQSEQVESKLKRSESGQKNRFRTPTFGYKKKMHKNFEPIEIPESPIVSSSAFGNNDQKL